MPTGMDMMVSAILKASGIDADKVKDDITAYGQKLAEKITSMDTALAAVKQDQARILEGVEVLRAMWETRSEVSPDATQSPKKSAGIEVVVNGGNHDS